jgi:hypothetical protein
VARRLALALAAAIALLAGARAARCEVSIALSLDRGDATLADSVVLSVSVSGAHGDAARPTIQGLEDFLVRPAGTSTRVQIVNGKYSAGTDFTYVLQPKKAGSFRVGPAELTVDGATYRSGVVTLAVGQPATSPDGERGPVSLVAALAPARLYVEQQAIYTLRLYRTVNIADVSVAPPEVDGVTLAKLGDAREYQGTCQGRPCQVVEVRYLVTPQRAGSFTLPPTRLELTVFAPQNRPRRGIFDDPFFGGMAAGRPLTLTTAAQPLLALPVPQEGRPADYGGLVGSFTLEAGLEPQALKAGESATLTATIRGRGNAKRLPELKLPAIDGLKIYADQPLLKDEADAEGVVVSKTVKWALVPEREGRYAIPPLEMSFFDAAAGRFRTLKTAAAALSVSPGSGGRASLAPVGSAGPAGAGAPAAKKAIIPLGDDILPIHAAGGAAGALSLPGGLAFWLLLLGPPAAFALALGGTLVRKRSGNLTAVLDVRRAAAALTGTCRRPGVTAGELLPALQEYLSRRLSLPGGALTAGEAAAQLRSRGGDAAAVAELQGIWRRLEDAIYAGKGRAAFDAGETLARLVERIERGLR